MTPYQRRRNPYVNRMAEDMQIRNLAARTIDSYTWHVDKFCSHFGKMPDELGPEEIRQYQIFLVHEKKASWSSFNQAVCALRFLYEVTLGKSWAIKHIPFGKQPKKLPVVLSDREASRLIECTHNLKHRMVLLCCYAAGLRLAEATHVKVADIDGQRAQIRITCGKGSKERRVPASPRLLDALRDYWKIHRPNNYLFPGRTPDVPLSSPTIQKACRLSAALKYLTRYLTGGPISNARIVGQSQEQVTFLARSKDKSQGNPQVEHTIPGVEFLRRWSLHILPKGFTRCRRYGGYHGSRCASFLETCRELLGVKTADPEPEERSEEVSGAENRPLCPRCHKPMRLLECLPRPSWRDVFQGSATDSRLVDFPWLRPQPQTRQHPFEPDG